MISSQQKLEEELKTERINTDKKVDALQKKFDKVDKENKKLLTLIQELRKELECKKGEAWSRASCISFGTRDLEIRASRGRDGNK